MSRSAVVEYILRHQKVLIETDFMREIWMIPERLVASAKEQTPAGISFTLQTPSPLYKHRLFVYENSFYAVESFERIDDRTSESKTYRVIAEATGIVYNPKESRPLCTPQDTFVLNPGEIENFTEEQSITTSIGCFIANYLFLVYPFGNIIPYLNEEFTSGKLEQRIRIPLLEGRISTKTVKDKYINTLTLFGQSNEMICPNISEKTLTVPPEIHELRRKLVEQHKEALAAGDASVMSDIEKQLIGAFKEHLRGDPSLHFLLKKKYFDVTLKKLLLTQGMTEVFGSPGKFVFIDNPMGDGWKIKDLPHIFNEVRQGSFARAVETANGGVIAKLILRVLQDTRISVDDCGTTKGSWVTGTKDQLIDYKWNYVVEEDGTNVVIDDTTLPQFVGKSIQIRTPGFCKATLGFCAKCFGKPFEVLGQKAFAPVANDFARNQTTASLKQMHGKSHSTVDVSDLNRFLLT